MPVTDDQIHDILQDFADIAAEELAPYLGTEEPRPIPESVWVSIKKKAIAKNAKVWPIVFEAISLAALQSAFDKTAEELQVAQLTVGTIRGGLNPLAQRYFEQNGTKFIKQLTRTDILRLKSAITEHFYEHEKPFAKRLKDSYICDGNESRLKRIKRTETHTASTGGSDAFARAAGAGWKEWVTAGDKRVRPSHRALHGENVPIDEPFSNGRMFPDEVNCRCSVAYHMLPPGTPGVPKSAEIFAQRDQIWAEWEK